MNVSVDEVHRVKEQTKSAVDVQFQHVYMEDILIVQNIKESRMRYIETKLEEAKNANMRVRNCIKTIAENLREDAQSAFDEVEKCYNLALQSWNNSAARYDEVVKIAENLLDGDTITKKCLSEDLKKMASCILKELVEIHPQFTKTAIDTNAAVLDTRYGILSAQRNCGTDPILNIQSTTANTITEVEYCFYKYRSEL